MWKSNLKIRRKIFVVYLINKVFLYVNKGKVNGGRLKYVFNSYMNKY